MFILKNLKSKILLYINFNSLKSNYDRKKSKNM